MLLLVGWSALQQCRKNLYCKGLHKQVIILLLFFFCRAEEEFNHSSPVIPGDGILSIEVSLMKANGLIACFSLITYYIRAQVTSLVHIAVNLHCIRESYVFTHSLCVILKMMENFLVFPPPPFFFSPLFFFINIPRTKKKSKTSTWSTYILHHQNFFVSYKIVIISHLNARMFQ